jgi:hypothetical protein
VIKWFRASIAPRALASDELLATLQSAQSELSKSWLGRQILQAGWARLQNQDGQQPLSNGRLSSI